MSDVDVLRPRRWYEGLTGYHWLVLVVAALGWSFDTMDQWLYVLVKTPAIADLLALPPSDPSVKWWTGTAQTIFILGWATGGLFFGMVGDRLGRTRTMGITILIYSAFTGLSGLSTSVYDFAAYRFLTGLGIGGEFAAGAALVAETFPQHARATALAVVQATSALGNVMAGVINLWIGANPEYGWRWVFAVGIIPAFLLFLIFMFIREPDAWVESRRRIRAGEEHRAAVPIFDLFRDPVLFRHTIVGVVLGAVGVIGFWGIGTWTPELFRNALNPDNLPELKQQVEQQTSYCIMMQNFCGFFGVLAYSYVAQKIGRRPAFIASLLLCAVVVPTTFTFTNSFASAMVLFGLMGFSLLTIFGGFAIYFPELFPTRLRATGTGFCYNVARYLAASGPAVFAGLSASYGMQRAALVVSGVFLLGLLVMPIAPETKDKKLPE
ncbi:MAG: MFS transporter [Candidatus Hydrogenedentes bacterium]|nr:MFS transporter [Candidatus Hydrogenedentota bacterium]